MMKYHLFYKQINVLLLILFAVLCCNFIPIVQMYGSVFFRLMLFGGLFCVGGQLFQLGMILNDKYESKTFILSVLSFIILYLMIFIALLIVIYVESAADVDVKHLLWLMHCCPICLVGSCGLIGYFFIVKPEGRWLQVLMHGWALVATSMSYLIFISR